MTNHGRTTMGCCGLLAALSGACVIGDETEGAPVRFAVGTPEPYDYVPGRVLHDVCVGVDIDAGYLRPTALVGDSDQIGPTGGAAVQQFPPTDLDCPPASDGFTGWARLEWRSHSGRSLVTLEARSSPDPGAMPTDELIDTGELGGDGGGGGEDGKPEGASASTGDLVLTGERFPGYDISIGELSYGTGYLLMPIDLYYKDTPALFGRAANDVALAFTFLPNTPVLVGTSTGTLTTDEEGHLEVLISTAYDSMGCGLSTEFPMFLTPALGGTSLAETLFCTE